MAFIGIDLGTTNSLVAVWRDGRHELIPNSLGDILTPSVISIGDDGAIIIGKAAKERLVTHADQTVACFKRIMGTTEKIQLKKNKFSPEELSGLILKQLKQDAEQYLGVEIEEAIISVPAYFNDNQRNSTKVAAQLAGLRVERLINEPTAAAIAYGIHEGDNDNTFIVIDLGGGTFDVSIMEKFDDLLEVHASAGDSFLGGEDFTEKLLKEICNQKDISIDSLNSFERGRIYRIFDQLKCNLSEHEVVNTNLEIAGKNYQVSLGRNEFFNYSEPLFKRLLAPIEKSIRDANIQLSDIQEIFLVGGATRMPAVRQFITRLFGRFPSCEINPDHVVAIGAAIQAALKQRNKDLQDIILTDVCPFSLGIEISRESQGGRRVDGIYSVIIERNQTIPASRVERFNTVNDNQTEISVHIYQGEHRLVRNNIRLGDLSVKVPKAKAGEEQIDVRFTYDINGLLEVIVTVVSTQKTKNLVIQNSPNRMDEKEIQIALKKLANIKIHPRDKTQNQAVISRAERIYQERLGDDRELIGTAITNFQACLEDQNERKIEIAVREITEIMDSLEHDLWS